MAQAIQKIKRDFARHKKKAGILAVLALVMLGFIVKAYFDMAQPRTAAAESTTLPPNTIIETAAQTPAESEARVQQNRELWRTLRQTGGIDSSVAFTFDTEPGYYNLIPNHKQPQAQEKPQPVDLTPKTPVTTEEAKRAARFNAVVEESRSLIVRSTVVGSGISKPVAVVMDHSSTLGDRILAVGDHIKGFEITAIRAREVDFKKDGITLAVKMPDETPH